VVQAFRLHKFESPIHDTAGRIEPVLALQLKSYADADPDVQPQQAIPLEVVKRIRSWKGNDLDVAVGQLVVSAFLFAMRSCEYSDVESGRLTEVIQLDDIRFRRRGEVLTNRDTSQLPSADTVSITFRKQKNRDNGATITQHRNDQPEMDDMCPVRTLAELVTRVLGYKPTDRQGRTKRKINDFAASGADEITSITSKTILRQIRSATRMAGESRLGLQSERVGTHSLRSGAAMAMYLAGVPSETIQLIGRWRSSTFMRYLRIQVPDTTLGVATRMTNRPSFFTIIHDNADERNPKNGGNQVDTQRRDTPPDDTTFARRTRGERQNY
jgi:hypothetical protein